MIKSYVSVLSTVLFLIISSTSSSIATDSTEKNHAPTTGDGYDILIKRCEDRSRIQGILRRTF